MTESDFDANKSLKIYFDNLERYMVESFKEEAEFFKKEREMNSTSTIDRLQNKAPDLLNKFGGYSQTLKTIEEMAELSKELAKRLNSGPVANTEQQLKAIQDEIADCLIMLFQLRFYYESDMVDERIEYKLDRAFGMQTEQK